MKRLGAMLAVAVLWSGSPAQAGAPANDGKTLEFRAAGQGVAARKVDASCTGKPTSVCVCYKLNCPGGKAALPPAPPASPAPPPPPPPPPAAVQRRVEQPYARAARTAQPPPVRKRHKKFRVRLTMVADMLPFQLDIRLGNHLSLVASFAMFASGKDPWFYLGGLFGLDYFPYGKAPSGFRISLRAGRVVWGKDKPSDPKGHINAARFTLGYNWIWKNGFTIGLGFGKQLLHTGNRDSKSKILFIPHMEFNMGVAF